MLQTLPTQAALQEIHAQEERAMAEWQHLYPNRWLLLEVTNEAEGEPTAGRLIAVAADDMTLVPLWQKQSQQGKITALLHGDYTEAGPTVVAGDAS